MDFDYIDNGGKIVLFLHGWGGDKNSFSWIKNHITETCSMIFVSFPGFGDSPPPQKPYFVDDFAKEVKSLLFKIAKGKKVNIVCHSFGCRVAVKLIASCPDLVDKLVIIDGAGVKPKRSLKYRINVLKYKIAKRKVEKGKLGKEVLNKYGSRDYKALSPEMKQTFVNIVNEDLKDCFKKVDCETLILWGEKDNETPLYMAKKINRWIKNSELIVFKGLGHFSFVEDVNLFVNVLKSFLF